MNQINMPKLRPVTKSLTYDELKAIHAAERLIRKLCGVGLSQEDLQHYTKKQKNNRIYASKAEILCEKLNSIWVPRC